MAAAGPEPFQADHREKVNSMSILGRPLFIQSSLLAVPAHSSELQAFGDFQNPSVAADLIAKLQQTHPTNIKRKITYPCVVSNAARPTSSMEIQPLIGSADEGLYLTSSTIQRLGLTFKMATVGTRHGVAKLFSAVTLRFPSDSNGGKVSYYFPEVFELPRNAVANSKQDPALNTKRDGIVGLPQLKNHIVMFHFGDIYVIDRNCFMRPDRGVTHMPGVVGEGSGEDTSKAVVKKNKSKNQRSNGDGASGDPQLAKLSLDVDDFPAIFPFRPVISAPGSSPPPSTSESDSESEDNEAPSGSQGGEGSTQASTKRKDPKTIRQMLASLPPPATDRVTCPKQVVWVRRGDGEVGLAQQTSTGGLPMAALNTVDACRTCNKAENRERGVRLKACGRCVTEKRKIRAIYCGEECLRKDWMERHKAEHASGQAFRMHEVFNQLVLADENAETEAQAEGGEPADEVD